VSENSTRTAWPPTGGSIKLDVHHQWAPTYINIGIGSNVTSFNISLVHHFNQTGNGTICLSQVGREQLSKLSLPDGTNATIQVIQASTSGSSLYNVRFALFPCCRHRHVIPSFNSLRTIEIQSFSQP
jgi:hypothetical protein